MVDPRTGGTRAPHTDTSVPAGTPISEGRLSRIFPSSSDLLGFLGVRLCSSEKSRRSLLVEKDKRESEKVRVKRDEKVR